MGSWDYSPKSSRALLYRYREDDLLVMLVQTGKMTAYTGTQRSYLCRWGHVALVLLSSNWWQMSLFVLGETLKCWHNTHIHTHSPSRAHTHTKLFVCNSSYDLIQLLTYKKKLIIFSQVNIWVDLYVHPPSPKHHHPLEASASPRASVLTCWSVLPEAHYSRTRRAARRTFSLF